MSERRLAYLSPLPPVRSGIADYSVDLLRGLRAAGEGAELCVVQVPGQDVAPELARELGVVPWSDVEAGVVAGEIVPWYQMGNNPYHSEIGRLARTFPGVVTLHDIWLHHLLVEETLARGDVGAYVDRLTEEHGYIGGAVALPPRWSGYSQAAVFALPAHRSLLEAQRGVLVHSTWAARLLAEEGLRVPVRTVPMPMPVPADDLAAREQAEALRVRLGVPPGARLLGSFGFQTPIKRTTSVIRALAEPGLEEVHLLVAGEASPAVDLQSAAAECGVEERVHEVGFLDEPEFQAAIQACDLCVNLRYPTAGETSASLLRTFARGRAAVVSDYAQFADFGEDVALRVPVGPSAEEAAALAALLRPLSAARLSEMGARARALMLAEHDPASSARAMLDVARTFPERPQESTFRHRPRRPTSRTWGELPSSVEVLGASDWPPGERREITVRLTNRGFASLLPAEAGPGGVAVAVRLLHGRQDRRAGEPWVPLPRRLEPGESCDLRVWIRRPPGVARLDVEPQVLGGAGFRSLGGGSWEGEV